MTAFDLSADGRRMMTAGRDGGVRVSARWAPTPRPGIQKPGRPSEKRARVSEQRD